MRLTMSKKKKTEKIGTIKAIDMLKQTKPMQDISFKTGKYLTEKDRPRKRFKPRDIDRY